MPFAQNPDVSNVSNKPMHHLSRANYDYVLLDVQSQWAMCERLQFIYGALICHRPRMMVLVSRLAMYHDQPDLAS
jgi:hypothetical protein